MALILLASGILFTCLFLTFLVLYKPKNKLVQRCEPGCGGKNYGMLFHPLCEARKVLPPLNYPYAWESYIETGSGDPVVHVALHDLTAVVTDQKELARVSLGTTDLLRSIRDDEDLAFRVKYDPEYDIPAEMFEPLREWAAEHAYKTSKDVEGWDMTQGQDADQ